MPTTWFTGVCDTLLSRIQTWHARYEQGQIYATRQYLTAVCEDRCASSCHAAHIWPALPFLWWHRFIAVPLSTATDV